MLLAQCPVCKDTLIRGADIVAAPCGHTYHEYCLQEWLKTKPNCPQCRKACRSGRVSRLYFDFVEEPSFSNVDGDNEAEMLRLRSTNDMLRSKLDHVETLRAKAEASAAEMVKSLEMTQSALRETDRKVQKERSEKAHLKSELRQNMELLHQALEEKTEIEQIRRKMETMKDVEKLIKGSADDVTAMLSVYEEQAEQDSPVAALRHVVQLLAVLRREVDAMKVEKKKMRREAHQLNRQLSQTQREVADHLQKSVAAQQALEQEKSYTASLERERDSLRAKVTQLVASIKSPASNTVSSLARRMALESPMVQPSTSTGDVAGVVQNASLEDLFQSLIEDKKSGRLSVDSNFFETPSPANTSSAVRPRGVNPFAVNRRSFVSDDESVQLTSQFNILRSHLLMSSAGRKRTSFSRTAVYDGLGSRKTPEVVPRRPPLADRPADAVPKKKKKVVRKAETVGGGATLDGFLRGLR